MEQRDGNSRSDRKHPRIYFEPGKRPLLKIGQDEFEVVDISATGLQFLVAKAVSLTEHVEGTISFFRGDTVDVAGTLVWAEGNAVGMAFKERLGYDLLDRNQKQAYLKTDIVIPQFVKPDTDEQEGYSVKDLSKLGISQDLLKTWMMQGFIEPSIKGKDGSASKNSFTRFDLYLVKIFDHLVNVGMSEEEASLKIKILSKGVKKPDDLFSSKPFLAVMRKPDYNGMPKGVKDSLFQLLSGKQEFGEEAKGKLTKLLKQLAPLFVDRKKKNELLQSDPECEEVIIVALKGIQQQVDAAVK